jgi:hypothetical protein
LISIGLRYLYLSLPLHGYRVYCLTPGIEKRDLELLFPSGDVSRSVEGVVSELAPGDWGNVKASLRSASKPAYDVGQAVYEDSLIVMSMARHDKVSAPILVRKPPRGVAWIMVDVRRVRSLVQEDDVP